MGLNLSTSSFFHRKNISRNTVPEPEKCEDTSVDLPVTLQHPTKDTVEEDETSCCTPRDEEHPSPDPAINDTSTYLDNITLDGKFLEEENEGDIDIGGKALVCAPHQTASAPGKLTQPLVVLTPSMKLHIKPKKNRWGFPIDDPLSGDYHAAEPRLVKTGTGRYVMMSDVTPDKLSNLQDDIISAASPAWKQTEVADALCSSDEVELEVVGKALPRALNAIQKERLRSEDILRALREVNLISSKPTESPGGRSWNIFERNEPSQLVIPRQRRDKHLCHLGLRDSASHGKNKGHPKRAGFSQKRSGRHGEREHMQLRERLERKLAEAAERRARHEEHMRKRHHAHAMAMKRASERRQRVKEEISQTVQYDLDWWEKPEYMAGGRLNTSPDTPRSVPRPNSPADEEELENAGEEVMVTKAEIDIPAPLTVTQEVGVADNFPSGVTDSFAAGVTDSLEGVTEGSLKGATDSLNTVTNESDKEISSLQPSNSHNHLETIADANDVSIPPVTTAVGSDVTTEPTVQVSIEEGSDVISPSSRPGTGCQGDAATGDGTPKHAKPHVGRLRSPPWFQKDWSFLGSFSPNIRKELDGRESIGSPEHPVDLNPVD